MAATLRSALCLVAALGVACDPPQRPAEIAQPPAIRPPEPALTATGDPSPPPVPAAIAQTAPARLEAAAPFTALPVPGYADAVVSLPLGASGPLPILVAAHGN